MTNRCSGTVSSSMIVVESSTDTLSTPFDREFLWPVAGIDKNHWGCELLRLAALEVDLKHLWGDKTGLACQQIQPLRRFDTALKGATSALDHALFTFAHGLHID